MRTLESRINNATKLGFNHVEAYCLMLYATQDGAQYEVVWNSRDGVTPFIIYSRDGQEMQHIAFDQDRVELDFVPAVGSRIFVDLTEEVARQKATERVATMWEEGERPLSERFETREAAVQMFLDAWTEREGQPHLVEVTEEMRERFKLLAIEWQQAIQSMPKHSLGSFVPDLERAARANRILARAEARRQKRNATRALNLQKGKS
ncbi:MAG: hypothetical protein QOD00_2926 [Blastocatellia bacterium]|nr:hypothetical protein [Blastocatellia bacterium]